MIRVYLSSTILRLTECPPWGLVSLFKNICLGSLCNFYSRVAFFYLVTRVINQVSSAGTPIECRVKRCHYSIGAYWIIWTGRNTELNTGTISLPQTYLPAIRSVRNHYLSGVGDDILRRWRTQSTSKRTKQTQTLTNHKDMVHANTKNAIWNIKYMFDFVHFLFCPFSVHYVCWTVRLKVNEHGQSGQCYVSFSFNWRQTRFLQAMLKTCRCQPTQSCPAWFIRVWKTLS